MQYKKQTFQYYFDLIIQKSKADLRTEAARGYLGVLWWIVEPIMYMGAFYVVFANVFKRGDESYVIFLLSGLIVWKWFHSSIVVGSNSLMANSSLMNQVYIPKVVFPLTSITVNTIKFLIIIGLFLLFLRFKTGETSLCWLFLPFIIITQLLLIIAITSFFSAIMPFFPDFKGILENILLMVFFLSGIFFDITTLPVKFQNYLSINPIAFVITSYRSILLKNEVPNWRGLALVSLFSLCILCVTAWLYHRFDRTYPKIIY